MEYLIVKLRKDFFMYQNKFIFVLFYYGNFLQCFLNKSLLPINSGKRYMYMKNLSIS